MESKVKHNAFTETQWYSNRSISSSRRFTRVNHLPTVRQTKTSNAPRAFPHQIRNCSLSNGKQNLGIASYLHKVKSAKCIDEKNNTSKYLLSLRKQYDKMAKNIKAQENDIKRMKHQIQIMREKTKNQNKDNSNTKNVLETKQNQLQNIIQKETNQKMQQKILQNILNRMKVDGLRKKGKAYELQELKKQKIKQLKYIEQSSIQWDESIHKITEKLNSIKKQYDEQAAQRRLKFTDYQGRIQELQQKQRFELQRKQRTYELLSIESNDLLDAKNIVLREVFLSHKMIDRMLELKIGNLLQRYNTLQNCFHRIKAQTNITDPNSLCTKYMSYAEALEELSNTINLQEKALQQLNQQNRRLKQLQAERQIKKLQEQKAMGSNIKQFYEQKQMLKVQVLEKQLIIKKINSWIQKIAKILHLKNGGKTINTFENICHTLQKELKDTKKWQHQKYQTPGMRLKKIVHQQSIKEQKIRLSEAHQIAECNISENMYLSKERRDVKRQNFLIKTQTTRKNSKV